MFLLIVAIQEKDILFFGVNLKGASFESEMSKVLSMFKLNDEVLRSPSK